MRRPDSTLHRPGLILTGLLSLVLTAFACQSGPGAGATTEVQQPGNAVARDISDAELLALMADRPDLLLIDVRTDQEWQQGHIPGAAFLDFLEDDFEERAFALPKDRPIAVYCAAGGRSEDAMIKMKKAGFKELYNLRGGFYGWEDAGRDVANDDPVALPAHN